MLAGKEFWVELIGYASIVSVAIFGLVGALSKEWERRREKAEAAGAEAGTAAADGGAESGKGASFSWSYIAAVGIILSAVFAMTTNILQDWIDAEQKEDDAKTAREEQTRQDERFETQLNGLASLDRQMQRSGVQQGKLLARQQLSFRQQQAVLAGNRQLNRGMRTALLQQAELRERALQTIGEIEATRSQVNLGTVRTLEAMWADSNRIDPPDIQVTFAYACPSVGEDLALFRSGAFARIGLRRASEVYDSDFREQQDFEPYLAFDSSEFFALQQDSSERRIALSAPLNDRMHMTRFSHFMANALFMDDESEARSRSFSDPEAWRNGGIEVIITARLEIPESRLYQMMPHLNESSLPTGYSAPRPQLGGGRQRVSRFPCIANLTVIVNGRMVINQHPDLLLVSGWSMFQQPTVLVRSYPFRIPADVFPVFPATAQPNQVGMPRATRGGP